MENKHFDNDVKLQCEVGMQLATVMADHVRPKMFYCTSPFLICLLFPPSSWDRIPPSQLSEAVSISVRRRTGALAWNTRVCERENRHLEGHDKMCEMKLGLQVQLDGHILHTCRYKGNNRTGNEKMKPLLLIRIHRKKINKVPSYLRLSHASNIHSFKYLLTCCLCFMQLRELFSRAQRQSLMKNCRSGSCLSSFSPTFLDTHLLH